MVIDNSPYSLVKRKKEGYINKYKKTIKKTINNIKTINLDAIFCIVTSIV